ncbi:MAG TPA: cobalamin biosynthesis protein CbiK [Desulfocapsa sulfexigens]|nr:cobalamin biosynthesis protein CbiK [Desulfocapsa sulfexigens]
MNQHGYIGRKLRVPKLKNNPAIIVVTFGTSSLAKAPLEIFQQEVDKQFPEYEIFWAYSSNIICRKKKIPTLHETLAHVEAAGFRKAVVQPLHIFPGTEYRQMAETCEYFPGLRVFLSETLLHRWSFVKETLAVVENEFLSQKEGLNLLAVHGTPLVADPVNSAYLGLEKLVTDRYPNVLAASIEGIPDYEAVLAKIKRKKLNKQYKKVKIIPMMYLAGMHAEEDLMGDKNSWRTALEDMSFKVECSTVRYEQVEYFKGLAYYPEIISFFTNRLQRSLELVTIY